MTTVLQAPPTTTTVNRTPSDVVVSTETSDTPTAAPELDIEAMKTDDAMAAGMVAGILTLAFVVLVVLMSIVCAWTFMSVGR